MKRITFKKHIRRYSLLILFMTVGQLIYAQSYTLNTFADTYTDITGTSLTNGLTWDEPELVVNIGFDFTAFGHTNSTLISVASGALMAIEGSNDTVIVLGPTLADLADRGCDTLVDWEGEPGGLSEISYRVDGAVGSRIFKMQWKNAGFYWEIDDDNISDDYVNLQMWLYEGSNIIEYRYGPNSVNSPQLSYDGYAGHVIVQGKYISVDNDEYFLGNEIIGNPNSPTLINNTNSNFTGLTGSIPNGMVYQLSQAPDAVQDIAVKGKVSIYPNPTEAFAHLQNVELADIEKIEVWNMLGQKSLEVEPSLDVDLSSLAAGSYLLQIYLADGVLSGVAHRK